MDLGVLFSVKVNVIDASTVDGSRTRFSSWGSVTTSVLVMNLWISDNSASSTFPLYSHIVGSGFALPNAGAVKKWDACSLPEAQSVTLLIVSSGVPE